jgi:hypothetical protein
MPPPEGNLLSAEGLAVGALLVGGVHLMGAHLNVIQRAVVLGVTVIGALLNGAGDALVCVAIHSFILLLIGFCGSITGKRNFNLSKYCIFHWFVLPYC